MRSVNNLNKKSSKSERVPIIDHIGVRAVYINPKTRMVEA